MIETIKRGDIFKVADCFILKYLLKQTKIPLPMKHILYHFGMVFFFSKSLNIQLVRVRLTCLPSAMALLVVSDWAGKV